MVVKLLMFFQLWILVICVVNARSDKTSNFKAVVKGNTEFAWNIYKEIVSLNKESNIVISPISISFALAMISLGANGSTLIEIQNALRFDETIPTNEIHKSFKRIKTILERNTLDYDLFVGNNVFVSKSFKIFKTFLREIKKFYHSRINRLNFAKNAKGSAGEINKWISSVTEGKIKSIITPYDIDSETRMVLVNALYFRGDWDQKFEPILTRTQNFYVSKDKIIQVEMMKSVRLELKYADDNFLKCQIVELPYYKKLFSMIILIPKPQEATLDEVENSLTSQYLTSLKLKKTFVTVSIPRFKLQADYQLDSLLQRLGINSLFMRGSADLSGIDESKSMYVSKILHKAIIEVTEEGSEAAAATGVLFTTKTEQRSKYFIADHPFLFLIKDNKSRTILFIGKVVEPESE